MTNAISFIKKRAVFFILILILALGIFLRTYRIYERFEFGHDGDLSSWIVKDIVINGHPRLIGQLTSAEGIFVGPLFYYLLIPFFLLTNMDPVGVTLLGVIIGALTIISYYFVLSKLFNKISGLTAAFLHAVSIGATGFDRWIVPTLPVKLWAIWYLYSLIKLARGNFSHLPFLGILVGLIWNIHIALYPALLAIPAAILVSRKLPAVRQLVFFILSAAATSLPLMIFEYRHNFIQTVSLINNFTVNRAGETGFAKLMHILNMLSLNNNLFFFLANPLSPPFRLPVFLMILLSALLLVKLNILKAKEVIVLFIWFAAIILFYTLTSTPISEYYFANLEIITVSIASLLIAVSIKSSPLGKFLIILLSAVILLKNISFYTSYTPYELGYKERKETVDYITADARSKGFSCIGLTYITKPGENVGFRYFFYLKNQHLVHPSLDIPVYNIVIPDELSLGEVKQKFGHIGVIPPTNIPSKEIIQKTCEGENTNLTDSMFGYVD